MPDSKETGCVHESRAVRVHWDNGRECCLVTSIEDKVFDASGVVRAYFDRWPFCEKQYAMMKASVCFHQVVGYGKKQVDDAKMTDRINKHQSDLKRLKEELRIPLSEIGNKEQELQLLFKKETRLKENSKIKGGKRIQSRKNKEALETCQRQIRKIQREIKKTEEPHKMKFVTYRKKCKEYARIQNKQKVCHVDVELDQLITSFRLSFANLPAFLAREILDDMSLEMNTPAQSILFLSGTVEQFPDRRKVTISRNKKDSGFMATLLRGLNKLNALKIRHPSGAVYEFELN